MKISVNLSDVLFYVEKIDSDYVLIDFVDSNQVEHARRLGNANYDFDHRPSMIGIVNYHLRRLKEGTTYRMRLATYVRLSERFNVVEDSLLLGFTLDADLENEEIFGTSVSRSELRKIVLFTSIYGAVTAPPLLNFRLKQSMVVVRDVGQGNWNEVINEGTCKLVFDAGTNYSTKKADVVRIVGDRDTEYQKSKPVVIVSHWDVDHYHCLLALSDAALSSFDAFICRDYLPTLTSRKFIGRLNRVNAAAIMPIVAVTPSLPSKESIALRSTALTSDGSFIFFNSYSNRSRNRCALGLAIRSKLASVVFSGDYDYQQISGWMLPHLNYKSKHYLIVPHHGGSAGKFTYRAGGKMKLEHAIVSVGRNSYKHPKQQYLSELRRIGFRVHRTDRLHDDYRVFL